ncbi:UNVERIFIED_CONTAM: hypothetical protein FKN15_054796 [Acipenser sinensis]
MDMSMESTSQKTSSRSAVSKDMELQVCVCGWSKATTVRGLKIHQGRMKCLREKGQGPRIDQYFLRSQSSQSNEIQRQEANHSSQDISTPVIDVRRTCMDTVSDEPNDPCEPALSVMFEADSERRKLGLPHRVNFLGRRSSEPEYQRSEDVELRGQHTRACQSAIFQLQDSLRDKLSPISVSASYSIKQTRHSNQPTNKLGALSPVLNAAMPSTLRTEVNFLREGCGDDKICQSNLQLSYRFGTRATTTDLFTPLAVDMEGMPVFSLSDQKTVALEVTVTNLPSDPRQPQKDGDDAHAAQLLVGVPETLSYSGFRGPQDKQLVCAANPNGSYAECELGNPMKRNGKVMDRGPVTGDPDTVDRATGAQAGDRAAVAAGRGESPCKSVVTSGSPGGVKQEFGRTTVPGGTATWDPGPAMRGPDTTVGCLGARAEGVDPKAPEWGPGPAMRGPDTTVGCLGARAEGVDPKAPEWGAGVEVGAVVDLVTTTPPP